MTSVPSLTRPATHGARFVAYDRNVVRVGNPTDGTTMAVRPETWVEEYSTITIAGFQEKSSNGFDTVYITFDAASTGAPGMKHNFGASAEAGGAFAERLRAAYESGDRVYVALETRRRKCREGNKDQPIDPLTPIHTLRGATGDSLKGKPQETNANCYKVLVAVGSVDDVADTTVASAKELRSDPAEWEQLRDNRAGGLAPEGWRCIVTPDGERRGGIIRNDQASQPSGPAASEIAAQVVRMLGRENTTTSARPEPTVRPVQRLRSTEGRPWEPLNSDGRPNAGSDLAAKIRATHETAVELMVGALDSADDAASSLPDDMTLEHAWILTDTLLWMGDRVQEHVVGRADRMARSHREAGMWVAQIARTRYPYSVDCITDDSARKGWAVRVSDAAQSDYRATYDRLCAYLQVGATSAVQSPADKPQSNPPTAGDDSDSVDAWKQLAAEIGMADHIDHLRFILKATFGVATGRLGEIDVTAFKRKVAEWAQDPQTFRNAAEQAFRADPENQAAG